MDLTRSLFSAKAGGESQILLCLVPWGRLTGHPELGRRGMSQ